MGLAFQYSFGSMLFVGVKRDAAYVARQIVRRMAKGVRVTSADASKTTAS
jgi:hypothetical protein